MEYGSNYPLELLTPVKSNFDISSQFNKSNIYYMVNGRSAIRALVKELNKFKKVYLPNYLCEDVYQAFNGKKREFYTLSNMFEYQSGLDGICGERFILYISNYFGLSNEHKLFKLIEKLKKNNEVFVIYDVTHNLYSVKSNINIDTYVGSLRKWMPIADGAILATNLKIKILNHSLDSNSVQKFITASYLKGIYINHDVPPFDNNIYRSRFIEVEQKVGSIFKPFKMSNESIITYNMFNHDDMIKRRDNYNTLLKLLHNKHINPIFNQEQETTIPFCFPILCKQRDKLRDYLIKHKVYCAIHWKQDFLINSNNYNPINEHILSIPIDQRHSKSDMVELANILNQYGGLDV